MPTHDERETTTLTRVPGGSWMGCRQEAGFHLVIFVLLCET